MIQDNRYTFRKPKTTASSNVVKYMMITSNSTYRNDWILTLPSQTRNWKYRTESTLTLPSQNRNSKYRNVYILILSSQTKKSIYRNYYAVNLFSQILLLVPIWFLRTHHSPYRNDYVLKSCSQTLFISSFIYHYHHRAILHNWLVLIHLLCRQSIMLWLFNITRLHVQ